jgi:hypothetical protein
VKNQLRLLTESVVLAKKNKSTSQLFDVLLAGKEEALFFLLLHLLS